MDTKLIHIFPTRRWERKKDNINLLINLLYIVGKMNLSVPSKRENEVWEKQQRDMVLKAETAIADILLIDDSIIFNFWRYPRVWKKHFNDVKPYNLGMRGDHVQHVLWRIKFGLMPINPSMVIIHSSTNNLMKNEPREIAEGIQQIGNLVKQRLPNSKMVITG